METKASQIRRAMAAQDWPLALRLAARLPRLDIHSAAIKRAHECAGNAAFYRQLGRDPEALIAAGIEALKDRFDHGSAPSGS
jgi:hypothetical protein